MIQKNDVEPFIDLVSVLLNDTENGFSLVNILVLFQNICLNPIFSHLDYFSCLFSTSLLPSNSLNYGATLACSIHSFKVWVFNVVYIVNNIFLIDFLKGK